MMSDRSSDRAEAKRNEVPGQPVVGPDFGSGSVASTPKRRSNPSYVTAARVAQLAEALVPSDWAVIETVRQFGLVSGPQLAAVHFGATDAASRSARRTLRRLAEVNVLAPLERRIGGVRAGSSGLVFRLGPAGLRLVGDQRRVGDEPGLHHLLHTLAVVDVLVRLKVAERAGTASGFTFQAEPDCWRQYVGPHGEPLVLKPDAFCDVRINDRRRLWFVEVDRGTVSTATLRQKLKRYGEYLDTGIEQAQRRGVFPRVVWVSSSERRSKHIETLCIAENDRLGVELHRLLTEEWQPPPRTQHDEQKQSTNKEVNHDP
jgi:hypothetical protein